MAAETQILMWSIAVLAVVIVNAFSKDPDAKGMSIMLALIWATSNVLAAFYSPPESMRLYPVMDLAGGLVAYAAWMRRHAVWKLLTAWLFFSMCLVHVAFWLHEAIADLSRGAVPPGSLLAYVVALNVLTAVQLVCVSSSGVSRVGVRIFEHLRRGSRLGAASPSP